MRAAAISAVALLVIAACSRSSSTEKLLIGSWETPSSTIVYDANTPDAPFPIESKETVQITFTTDHKEVWRVGGGPVETVATWHVEGDYLVFTLETQSESGPAGTVKRERIKKITADELVFTDGTVEGRWRRVRP